VDVSEIKERIRGIWSRGDYAYLSRMLEPVSIALCDACAVSAGQEVLDVAAGDGNFALACAREGASVVASDLSPTMVERGRERSQREGCEVEWTEADAEELPFEDARFDCVGSVFGAMIAPRPEVVARELFRVVRPGGTVGMAAWVPGSFTSELIALGRKYAPPPEGQPLSEEWGVEETVRQRFDGLAGSLELVPGTLVWEDESAEAMVERFGTTAPTMVAAREAMPPERFEALWNDTVELARRFNRADDGSLRIESEYLLSVGRKRG
jgi:SAM-dependent methyltransferase